MIRIISLTESGQQLAQRIADLTIADNHCHHRPQPFQESVQQWFTDGDRLILITAMGIAVRTLAPVLHSKYQDPAVLVLDEQGKFIVPLLSGHQGGANEWGRELSQQLTAQLVVTTANSYQHPIYTMGIGCERNCPLGYIERLIETALKMTGLTISQISHFSSLTLKSDEPALQDLAIKHNKDFVVWSVAQLTEVEPLLQSYSDYVYQTVGVYGVAESAALYSAKHLSQSTPELLLNKIKNEKATCAIARCYPREKII